MQTGEVCTVSLGYWSKPGKDRGPHKNRLLVIKVTAMHNVLFVIPVTEQAGEGLSNVNHWCI